MKPIAFIDIDGVLNRLVSNNVSRKMGYDRVHFWCQGNRWKLHMDKEDRARLLALADHFELAWGTTWEHEAYLGPGKWLGLPPFDIVATTLYHERSKAPGVLRAADGRPFVWLDDTHYNHTLYLSYAEQPHLLVDVAPEVGLTWTHVSDCIDWAGAINEVQDKI